MLQFEFGIVEVVVLGCICQFCDGEIEDNLIWLDWLILCCLVYDSVGWFDNFDDS